MKTQVEKVSTKDDGPYDFEMPLPESLEEAQDVYGEENSLWLLNSGLKVKLQNVAREAFRQSKNRGQVEEAVQGYRPGSGSRKSSRDEALELLMDKAPNLQSDPDWRTRAKQAFSNGNFKKAVEILKEDEM